MRKILFFSLLVLGVATFLSCQSTKAQMQKDTPVDIVFEKWNIQFGQLQSMDITLKGNSNSGDAVEVKTTIRINQYDVYLLPMLAELEEKGQFKDGNTGAGVLKINKEIGNGKLFITKVGSIITENMEFSLEEEQVSVFAK